MTSMALRRINKELEFFQKEGIEGFTLIDSNDIWVWKGILHGPVDSPYENGNFPIQITFEGDYPLRPPSFRFLKIPFHPNIYRDGKICMDILEIGNWAPGQTIRTIILSIRSLFMDPNPNSPANADAAKMYMSDINLFNKTAKEKSI